MRRKDRKKMGELQEKYLNSMNKINSLHNNFLKELDKFRMNCVGEILKLKYKDKELQTLVKEADKVYIKNQEKKKK